VTIKVFTTIGEIRNELRDLADYIHEKEPPTVLPPS
jgi:hypothetical protein